MSTLPAGIPCRMGARTHELGLEEGRSSRPVEGCFGYAGRPRAGAILGSSQPQFVSAGAVRDSHLHLRIPGASGAPSCGTGRQHLSDLLSEPAHVARASGGSGASQTAAGGAGALGPSPAGHPRQLPGESRHARRVHTCPIVGSLPRRVGARGGHWRRVPGAASRQLPQLFGGGRHRRVRAGVARRRARLPSAQSDDPARKHGRRGMPYRQPFRGIARDLPPGGQSDRSADRLLFRHLPSTGRRLRYRQPGGLAGSPAERRGTAGLGQRAPDPRQRFQSAVRIRIDRHAHIGQGHIGAEAFRRILAHPKLRAKPFILETPIDNPGDDRRNLDTLKALARRTHPAAVGR